MTGGIVKTHLNMTVVMHIKFHNRYAGTKLSPCSHICHKMKNHIDEKNPAFSRPDRITEDTRKVEGSVGDYYSILFVKDTNELDSGKFSCKVKMIIFLV